MIDISEKNFEASIEQVLLAGAPVGEARGEFGDFTPGGYHRRTSADYARELCLIPQDVLGFIYVTQPEEWGRFKEMLGADAKDRLLKRLASQVRPRGTLEVLREGIKCDGSRFRMAYFRPASELNEELQRLYEANLFSVVRQLHYSQKGESSKVVWI